MMKICLFTLILIRSVGPTFHDELIVKNVKHDGNYKVIPSNGSIDVDLMTPDAQDVIKIQDGKWQGPIKVFKAKFPINFMLLKLTEV
jgi:hypothetical protein